MESILSLLKQGKAEQAQALCQQALACDPNNPGLMHVQAMICYVQKDYAAASESIVKAAAELPADPSLEVNWGLIDFAQGDFAHAITHFKQAIKLKPEYLPAYINLGYLFQQQKQYQQALNIFNDAINHAKPEDKKNIAAVYFNRAVTFARVGMLVQAMRSFEQVLEHNPKHINAKLHLANMLINKHAYEDALEILTSVLDENPQQSKALYLTALCHDQNTATEYADKAKRRSLDPREQVYRLFAQGHFAHTLNQPDAAWEAFTTANRLVAKQRPFQTQDFNQVCAAMSLLYQKKLKLMPTSTDKEQPLFILGCPKSGKSLLTQFLKHHADFNSIGAGSFFSIQFNAWIQGDNLAEALQALNTQQLNELAKHYSQYQAQKLHHSATWVIDHGAFNVLIAGLLYQLFPKARFAFITRNVMDTALENFFTFFEENHTFASNWSRCLETCQRMQEMQIFWQSYLPAEQVFSCHYEELVQQPVKTLNSLCIFLGLPLDGIPQWLPSGETHLDTSHIGISKQYSHCINS